MTSPGDSVKSALFRAAPGGWVFRSPNPWVFGDTPHYLVNDAQKSQIEAIVALRRPRVVAAVLLGGILAWTVLVATFMWAFAGHQDPTLGDIGVMVVLIFLPLIALLPIAGLIQRRRLKPVLAAAPLTTERILFAELQKKVRAATPLKQSLNALVASLFAFFSASFAVLIHILTRHFPFDSYVALWGFVAIAFGFASPLVSPSSWQGDRARKRSARELTTSAAPMHAHIGGRSSSSGYGQFGINFSIADTKSPSLVGGAWPEMLEVVGGGSGWRG